jgi:hypothetical protein
MHLEIALCDAMQRYGTRNNEKRAKQREIVL